MMFKSQTQNDVNSDRAEDVIPVTAPGAGENDQNGGENQQRSHSGHIYFGARLDTRSERMTARNGIGCLARTGFQPVVASQEEG